MSRACLFDSFPRRRLRLYLAHRHQRLRVCLLTRRRRHSLGLPQAPLPYIVVLPFFFVELPSDWLSVPSLSSLEPFLYTDSKEYNLRAGWFASLPL